MGSKKEGSTSIDQNAEAEPQKATGMLTDLGEEPWPRPEHADLLAPVTDHVRLLPKDIRELIDALDLQMEMLRVALSATLHNAAVDAIMTTRAFKLVSALRVELEALAQGTKSAALLPDIHGQLRNYKSVHPDYLLMKDEAAAAVQILVDAGNITHRGEARKLVAEAINPGGKAARKAASVSFEAEAIRAREDELISEGRYARAVNAMTYTAFPKLPKHDWTVTDRMGWIRTCLRPEEVVQSIEARLGILALVAGRLRPVVK